MALYHVTGEILYPSGCNCDSWNRRKIDRLVHAKNGSDAVAFVGSALPSRAEWLHDPVTQIMDLEEAEQIELARWNAGSPTSSPFALATARGEL